MDVHLKVAVRCRPMNSREKALECNNIITISDTTVHIKAVDAQHEDKDFKFDYCYGSDSLQTKVYADMGQPIVLKALDGINGTIFAYGQTGSGKTFTMQGLSEAEGILPQLCDDLFEKLTSKLESSAESKFIVTVSFLEIYNEEINDLLNPSDNKLKIREHPNLGIYVEGLCELVAKDSGDLVRRIEQGNHVRRVAATNMNAESSRAHSVLTIKVEQQKVTEIAGYLVREEELRSRITLVDLAGSERASKTAATGDRLKEGANINLSLMALGNVINRLAEGTGRGGKNVIPYRESKLTRLLQESLGGNAMTVMIAAISPADYNYTETMSTLKYAYRAKSVVNKISPNITSYEHMSAKTAAETIPASVSASALQQDSNSALLANALKQGSKPWKRSKFSLLGQGRAGKTAFANAIAGRQFEETASTVGINQLTCDVKHIQATGAGHREQEWGECTKNAREFEAALADIMTRAKRGALGEAAGGDIRAYMHGLNARGGVGGGAGDGAYDSGEEDEVGGAAENGVTYGEEEDTGGAGAGLEGKPNAGAVQGSAAGGDGASESSAAAVEQKAATRLKKNARSVPADGAPLDEEMVMKMLATMQNAESGLLISLFDFGGQSVFEVIHHLFLTRNGVYALVFNMEWLLTDGPDKERALRFMRGWLSSIAVHTFNKSTQMTAPIVIVGTRLDTVTSPAAHEKISTVLHEHFSDNLAWRSVIGNEEGRDSNGRAFQWFFPVDNKLGKQGPAMKHLMSVVSGVIDKAEYTHKEVPLTWFKTIDQMADTQRDCLSLQEVVATAERSDVSAQEVPLLLSFLHDMGHLMWLDEPGLRDVVILDPVSYLVVPATIIICKLSPDHEDTTHHFMASHRECERMHKREWMLLKHSGVLSVKLLPILWEPYIQQTEALLMLMVKFGLLVPLRSEGEGPVTQYLVPTLLAPAPLSDPNVANWADGPYSSCHFVFTLAEELCQSSTVTDAELKSAGFLPGGMFERIVGKALSWSQDTAMGCSIDLQRVMLHKDMAVLAFGRQRFRLVHCADIHCVRVDVEGANPLGIQQKLFDFVKRIIDECMKSLLCFPAVSFPSESPDDTNASPAGLVKSLLPTELLIPLQQLRKAGKGASMLAWRGGRTLLTLPEIKSKYGQWLQLFDRREQYDAFISYRWGRFDSEFTEQLFDMFTNFSVGAQSRAVEVFLDRKRLQEGRLFKSDFAAALTHSLVALPVVSVDALGRMLEHAPSTVDNVLLEWVMILESFRAGRVQKVYPILFGKRTSHVSDAQGVVVTVSDLFSDGCLNALPCIAPTATLAQAAELLRANGIEPSEHLHAYTVHSIVHALLQFLLCKASDFAPNRLVESFAGKVVGLLEDCGDASVAHVSFPSVQAPVQAPVQSAPVSSSGGGGGGGDAVGAAAAVQAAPQRTGLALKDLTAEEVGELLERSGYKKVCPVFLANEITGQHLFLCEEFADLMAEEFGVTSKPVAKLLMASIETWRKDGIDI